MPLIFSDDLTGACDVGAECQRSGWRVRVECGREGWDAVAGPGRGEVVVANLETRRLSPSRAGEAAGKAGASFKCRGLRPVFFKMDSTLRGNYEREAGALRSAVGAKLAWFVPANPGQGRWTVEGRVYVGGNPLERTAYARDPLHPIRDGKVAPHLYGRHLARLSLRENPSLSLRARMVSTGARFVVADAICEEDLARIAGAVSQTDLVFGASPMARHIIGRFPASPVQPMVLGGKWLGIIGSLNPLTETQVRAAAKLPGVKVSWLGPRSLLAGNMPRIPAGSTAWIIALRPSSFRPFLARKGSRERGNRIARALGVMGEACRDAYQPSGLILSGGLTATGVFERMGVGGLILDRELAPGLVLSRAMWNGPSLGIITKPGGFGSVSGLADIVRMTRRA